MKSYKTVIILITLCLCISAFPLYANEGGEKGKEKESAMVQVDPFVLNLRDAGNSKFLKLVFCLELSSPSLGERIKSKMAVIRDAVIMLVTSKTCDDVRAADGRLQLKDELIMNLNQVLGKDTIKNVYFTDFVMQ